MQKTTPQNPVSRTARTEMAATTAHLRGTYSLRGTDDQIFDVRSLLDRQKILFDAFVNDVCLPQHNSVRGAQPTRERCIARQV